MGSFLRLFGQPFGARVGHKGGVLAPLGQPFGARVGHKGAFWHLAGPLRSPGRPVDAPRRERGSTTHERGVLFRMIFRRFLHSVGKLFPRRNCVRFQLDFRAFQLHFWSHLEASLQRQTDLRRKRGICRNERLAYTNPLFLRMLDLNGRHRG